MGYSYLVKMIILLILIVSVENLMNIIVFGMEKEIVGEFVVKIWVVRFFEFYKGKGIVYENEIICCKVGKIGKK